MLKHPIKLLDRGNKDDKARYIKTLFQMKVWKRV